MDEGLTFTVIPTKMQQDTNSKSQTMTHGFNWYDFQQILNRNDAQIQI